MRQVTLFCDGAGCGARIPAHEAVELKCSLGSWRTKGPLHFCSECQDKLGELIGPGAGVNIPPETETTSARRRVETRTAST